MNPGGVIVREILVENVACLWDQPRIKGADNRIGQLPRFHRVNQEKLDVFTGPSGSTKIACIDLDLTGPRRSPFFKFLKKTFCRFIPALKDRSSHAAIHPCFPAKEV